MAADACDRRVVTGPIEATAIGNVMMQALSNGDVASIAEAREVIRNSFAVDEYVPTAPEPWHAAYDRFVKLVERQEELGLTFVQLPLLLERTCLMIKIGIAGIGFMGWIHYLAYQRVAGARIVALCEQNRKRLGG